MKTGAAALLMTAAVLITACFSHRTPAARASTPQLVYVCGQVPCQNSQELTVSDHNGAPIFSVGEYGGPAVFGDNLKVYAPGAVYNPALTFSYTSPAVYDKTFRLPDTCVAPSKWIAPQGTWLCRAGRWRRIGP